MLMSLIAFRGGQQIHAQWGEAEDAWVAQSEEEEAKRWLYCSLQVPEEGKQREVPDYGPGNQHYKITERHKAAPGEA